MKRKFKLSRFERDHVNYSKENVIFFLFCFFTILFSRVTVVADLCFSIAFKDVIPRLVTRTEESARHVLLQCNPQKKQAFLQPPPCAFSARNRNNLNVSRKPESSYFSSVHAGQGKSTKKQNSEKRGQLPWGATPQ